MLSIRLNGANDVSARLNSLPDALRAALTEKIGALTRSIYGQVVDVNLAGGVLSSRTGTLRDSIECDVEATGAQFSARILSNGDAPYAGILEFGGKTAAHTILPDKAKVLAFIANGKQMFARKIEHPGSTFPARSYLRSALDDASADIESTLSETVVAIASQMKGNA